MENAYLTPDHELLRDQVARFIAREVEPHAERWETEGQVPREVLRKMGAAGLLSPAIVIPATGILPFYEQFQGSWTAQHAVDFLNKLVSPGSPKNGPWAFKGCAISP